MIGTKKQKLEMEIKKFNSKDPDNQRNILGFIVDKKRDSTDTCRACSEAYKFKFCVLCGYILDPENNLDPSKLHQDFTYGRHKQIVA
tara:strand:+ start:111 stop:371 length:261 start_codon:yes stop_codon:yes gene_type:complete